MMLLSVYFVTTFRYHYIERWILSTP